MFTIIKTILGKTGEEYKKYIVDMQDPEKKAIISEQEKEMINFLADSYDNSNQFPTDSYFLSHFEGATVPLSRGKELSLIDLKVHYANFIKKRVNANVSKVLMSIADETAKTGLTYEHMDKIRGYLNISGEDIVDDTVDTLDSFKDYYAGLKEKPKGIQTGVKEFDSKLGGVSEGVVAILGGFTGSYKTTFAVNMCYNNAKNLKYNIVYVSLEVPKEQLLIKMLGRHSFDPKFTEYNYIPHEKIRQVMLEQEEENYLMDVVAPDFYKTGGMIKILDEKDFKTFSMSEIREKLEQIDEEMLEKTGYPLDAVFWDHANLFKFNGSGNRRSSDTSEGNEYVSFIRKLAISFKTDKDTLKRRGLSMVILAQTSRDGWRRAEKLKGKYDLRSLAEINELERAGSIILMVYTNEDMKMSKEASLQLLKNRNGPTIEEPNIIFVDPEAYVAGEEMEGFSEMLSADDFDSVFGEGSVADIL